MVQLLKQFPIASSVATDGHEWPFLVTHYPYETVYPLDNSRQTDNTS